MIPGCCASDDIVPDKLDLAIDALRAQVEPVTLTERTKATSEIVYHLGFLSDAELFAYRDSMRVRAEHRCPGRH